MTFSINNRRRPKASAQESVATRVSMVGILANCLLTAFKLLAALVAHSSAMLSDALHSASDILSGLIVIVGMRLSAKAPDRDHPYGHDRFECIATLLLAWVLTLAGGSIGINALKTIFTGAYRSMEAPGLLALIAAAVSIATKEALFWYTRAAALRIHSSALKAEAWHHRSDALSSVGALIGIGAARLGYPITEPIASALISLLILKISLDIFREAIDRMVDHAASPEIERALRDAATGQPGVVRVDMIHTRMFGNRIYVDLEIAADPSLPLAEAHAIAEAVHDRIEQSFPEVKHIMVHVNPAGKDETKPTEAT